MRLMLSKAGYCRSQAELGNEDMVAELGNEDTVAELGNEDTVTEIGDYMIMKPKDDLQASCQSRKHWIYSPPRAGSSGYIKFQDLEGLVTLKLGNEDTKTSLRNRVLLT